MALIDAKLPDWPEDAQVRYLWKARGGRSGGKAVYGKCVKVSGLAAFLADGADYIVWLGADVVDAAGLTRWQVEAYQ